MTRDSFCEGADGRDTGYHCRLVDPRLAQMPAIYRAAIEVGFG